MKFPPFSLPASDGATYTEKNFSKGVYVLYLYPKDLTSGCTIEAQNFRDLKKDFEKIGVQVFGLSKDPIRSHEKFCTQESLNFPLLSDENTELIQALGAWQEKSMYGRKYMGIDRSTFVIQDGAIVREWRKVSVTGHAQEVLEFCQTL
ncbi:peroxiredoxin [Candidatus Gracilibacteria bacterium]|nr:peroxiredoxin [Candidatus Gracilibacteria bacterium]